MNSIKALQIIRKEIKKRWITNEAIVFLLDTNGDGRIDLSEFGDFCLQMRITDKETTRRAFKEIDQDQDGFIRTNELLKLINYEPQNVLHEAQKVSNNKEKKIYTSKEQYLALVAHNNMKKILVDFVKNNKNFFSKYKLVTTGSTGSSIEKSTGIKVSQLVASGPLGGDQAVGGMLSEKKIAGIFFFKDPLSSHPHASDIEALTRLCDVYQIPYASNAASAIGLILAFEKLGLNWDVYRDDSPLVKDYKNSQKTVIEEIR